MDITILSEKLAEIIGKLTTIIEKINIEAGGEAFYARVLLVNEEHLVGLVDKLRVNQYKIVFELTEESLVGGKIKRKVSKKEIELEKIRKIEAYKTISGRLMFIKA